MNYSKAWANNELEKLLTHYEHRLHSGHVELNRLVQVQPMLVVSEQFLQLIVRPRL
jgi:hypothetical protein